MSRFAEPTALQTSASSTPAAGHPSRRPALQVGGVRHRMPGMLIALVFVGVFSACSMVRGKPTTRSIEVTVQVVAIYPDGIRGCFTDGDSFVFSCFHGKIVAGDFKGGNLRFASAKKDEITKLQRGDLLRLKIDEDKLKRHLHDVQQPEFDYVFLYERDCSFEKITGGDGK